MPEPKRYTFNPSLAWIFILATVLVGFFALIAFVNHAASEAQAICLVAAALAFGFVSNALWRK